jgi:hypothetical protein
MIWQMEPTRFSVGKPQKPFDSVIKTHPKEKRENPPMRDSHGRFSQGCSPRPGRPAKSKQANSFNHLAGMVSAEDWQAIVSQAVVQARNGDAAAREWLSRFLPPTPPARPAKEGGFTQEQLEALCKSAAFAREG